MKLYYMNINTDEKKQQELLEALGNKAPACYTAVQQKVNEYRQERDQLRSVGAYLLLAYAYEQQSDELHAERMADIVKTTEGKPIFEGTHQVHFNLSHSGDYVACVISDGVCGVDIQEIRPFKEHFAKRFFSEKEQIYIEYGISNGRDKDVIGTEIWCKKESLGKCRGYGLARGTQPLDTEECAEQIGVVYALLEEGYMISYCSCSILKERVEICEVKYSQLESWLFQS